MKHSERPSDEQSENHSPAGGAAEPAIPQDAANLQDEAEASTDDLAGDASPDPLVERASKAAIKLEPIVLEHIGRPEYQPVKPRVIAKQLKLPSEQHKALKLAIKRLAKRGKLEYGDGHLVRPAVARTQQAAPQATPAERLALEVAKGTGSAAAAEIKKGIVVGKFRRAQAGFGFVRPATAPRGSDRRLDIFIPQNKTLDAASGDTVKVRLSKQKVRGKQGQLRVAGEITEVVERDTHQFVGIYRERAGEAFVEIDGRVFKQPVPVGDPGAKNANPDDKVVVEMVQFPSPLHPGEAVITEVLGARGAPGVDTLSIIREFGLPEEFAEDALEDAREQADRFDESTAGRLDLTNETIITIDPVDARDFDDAISLVELDNGHFKLGVHIADVSHFVQPKTALDREARERGTSVYLPDRVIPMLPEVISNNLASLQPNKVRYTQTAYIEFTRDGVPVHSEFHRSAIESTRRFTYEEVDDYLADPAAWQSKLTPAVHALVGRMHSLAMTLRKRRLGKGAIELTLPELKIDLDRQGEVTGAHLVVNTVSHQIIEEFMLAANEAVARMLTDKEIDFLRRVHEQPDPRKLLALTKFVQELGIPCDDLQSRFEIKRVIAEVAGEPEEHAVNYSILRSMQKAIYSPMVEGHYALNSEHYCHFTSPIRRYPDLMIHRALEALSRGKRPPEDIETLVMLGDHCSDREQRAAEAERELTKVKLLTYLASRIGMQMDAVITGVEEFGLFAQGVELPAEGLIHVTRLDDDHYRFERESHSLVGFREGNQYRLGDHIRVEVAFVNVDGRELDFRIVKRLKQAPKKPIAVKEGKGRRAKASDGREGPTRTRPTKGGKSSSKGAAGGRGGLKHGKAERGKPPRGKRGR
jgi:ribonuclease R